MESVHFSNRLGGFGKATIEQKDDMVDCCKCQRQFSPRIIMIANQDYKSLVVVARYLCCPIGKLERMQV